MTLLLHVLLYIGSFLLIWLGSGLIVSSMDKFSRRLRISQFAISFVILGLLTSAPEFAVGLSSVSDNDPEIFVGNLLGGIPVIFLFVIPILAIFGNGINLKHEMTHKSILATLGVVLAPSLLVLDKTVSLPEGFILIIMYLTLVLFVQRKHGLFDIVNTNVLQTKAYSYKDIIKVLVGIGIVFATSNIILDQTLYFSSTFHISPFLISLLVLSLGTNLPELSLAIRSILLGKKDIAFGDYMGSAAANTFLFGILTVLSRGEFTTQSNFVVTFFFILVGLVLFYVFAMSKNKITRFEGGLLLLVYLAFVIVEIVL